jgi:starvation-inducible DNA-binding protein
VFCVGFAAADSVFSSRNAELEMEIDMTTGDNARKALANSLNTVLADSFALYFKTKNFHWHVSGPHFRDYHLMFDEQATQILMTTDMIAERVRKIGQRTLTSIGDVSKHQNIADNDAENLSADQMLSELREDNLTLVNQLRAAKALAGEAGDNATDGMIDDWTDQAEQRAWFLLESAKNG